MNGFYITNQLPRKAKKGTYKKAIRLSDGNIDNGLLFIDWDKANKPNARTKIKELEAIGNNKVEIYLVLKEKK